MEDEMGRACTMHGRISAYRVLEGKTPTRKTYVYMGG
jgi:hypothetical protein